MITNRARNRPLRGILWMLASGLCFVAVTALVKHVGDGLPAAQTAFIRYLLGCLFLLPTLAHFRGANLGPRALAIFGTRGFLQAMGSILWFFAMTNIPMAEVTAMNYMTPIYITLGAALFLGEELRLRRILAILAAFCGALIILRPGMREVLPGHIAMIGTAMFFAASYMMAKRMSDTIHPSVMVGMLSITVTIFLAPFAIAVWVPPTLEQVLWLLLVAGIATGGHYTMTLAFANAPVTVTQPVTFLQLVWSALIGLVVFGEAVDPFVVLGGIVIMAAVAFITWREAILRAQAARGANGGLTAPPADVKAVPSRRR